MRPSGPPVLAWIVLIAAAACGGRDPAAPDSLDVPRVFDPSRIAADPSCATGLELGRTYASAEALARDFLAVLSRDDLDELLTFAVEAEEFRCRVWPYLPASQPGRGLTVDYVWTDLNQKSLNSLGYTWARYAGRTLGLRSLRFAGATTDYGAFRVHRETRLVVIDEDGGIVDVQLFGSILEAGGRFKLFSYVTD